MDDDDSKSRPNRLTIVLLFTLLAGVVFVRDDARVHLRRRILVCYQKLTLTQLIKRFSY